jgi:hypothetical protein
VRFFFFKEIINLTKELLGGDDKSDEPESKKAYRGNQAPTAEASAIANSMAVAAAAATLKVDWKSGEKCMAIWRVDGK